MIGGPGRCAGLKAGRMSKQTGADTRGPGARSGASDRRIFVVCVNPVLDFIYEGLSLTDPGRDFFDRSILSAGGFGPNVARSLRVAGRAATCLLCTGGWSGELLRRQLRSEHLNFWDFPSDAPTRVATISLRPDGAQMTVGPSPEIAEGRVDQVMDAALRLSEPEDLVLVGGSLAAPVEERFLGRLADLCRMRRFTCLDIRTASWRCLLEMAPYAIKLPSSLPLEEARAAAHSYAREGGVSLILWSGSSSRLSAWTPDGSHGIEYPRIEVKNPFGAGDCLLGALASELSRGRTVERALPLAVAAASASVASVVPGEYEPALASSLFRGISLAASTSD